jgi:hypothetical protein
MMWPLIIVVIFVVIAAWVLMKRTGKEELPHVRYVCDICGEKDCICHKEEVGTH